MMTRRVPVRWFFYPDNRRFSAFWCNAWLDYLTGLSLRNRFDGSWHHPKLSCPGWCRDLRNIYLRARYGWAPVDVWDLHSYVNGVLAGSLTHLANHTHGTPTSYLGEWYANPDHSLVSDDMETHEAAHTRWTTDLHRWAQAFAESPDDVNIYDAANDYRTQNAEETRRRTNIEAALRDLSDHWFELWD
jgi:hypothetical protein